jgi:hypothetical protein
MGEINPRAVWEFALAQNAKMVKIRFTAPGRCRMLSNRRETPEF